MGFAFSKDRSIKHGRQLQSYIVLKVTDHRKRCYGPKIIATSHIEIKSDSSFKRCIQIMGLTGVIFGLVVHYLYSRIHSYRG